MLLTFIAFLVCFELPRVDEAFHLALPSLVEQDGNVAECVLVTASERRAAIAIPPGELVTDAGRTSSVLIPTVGWIRAETIDGSGPDLHVELHPTAEQRRRLIVFLFAQPMPHIAESARMGGALRGLFRRAFAA